MPKAKRVTARKVRARAEIELSPFFESLIKDGYPPGCDVDLAKYLESNKVPDPIEVLLRAATVARCYAVADADRDSKHWARVDWFDPTCVYVMVEDMLSLARDWYARAIESVERSRAPTALVAHLMAYKARFDELDNIVSHLKPAAPANIRAAANALEAVQNDIVELRSIGVSSLPRGLDDQLTDSQRKVFNYIANAELPVSEKQVMDAMVIGKGVLRRWCAPNGASNALYRNGVRNKRGAGYYLPKPK